MSNPTWTELGTVKGPPGVVDYGTVQTIVESAVTVAVAEQVAAFRATTLDVHGIADTTLLETVAGAQAKVNTAIQNLIGAAPPDLNEWSELAARIQAADTDLDGIALALSGKANLGDLAPVATTGSYSSLTGKPTIPTTASQVGAEPAGSVATGIAGLAAVARTGAYGDLANRPTIPTTAGQVGADPAGTAQALVNALPTVARTGAYADLTGKPTIPTAPSQVGADPAGTAAAAVTAHNAVTTNVHGIANTALLETLAGAQAKADAARDQAISTLLGGAPAATLDTIAELAEAFTGNQSVVAGLTTQIAGKANAVHAATHQPNGSDPLTLPATAVDETTDRKWMTAAERSRLGNALTDLIIRSTGATRVFGSRVTGDTQDRFTVETVGTLRWGPGGSAAVDTALYRNATNNLRTTGAFTVDGTLNANIVLVGNATQPTAVNAATRKDYVDTAINNVKDRQYHTGTQSADTVDESATRKWLTVAERTKIAAQLDYVGQPSFLTTSTGASDAGKWTRIATNVLGYQFADVDLTIDVQGTGTGSAAVLSARVIARAKQQGALGTSPTTSLVVLNPVGFAATDFRLVVASTDATAGSSVALWMRVPLDYETVHGYLRGQPGARRWDFVNTDGYVTDAPTGVQFTPGATSGSAVTQSFTNADVNETWNKPAGAKFIQVVVVAGGGGGGCGFVSSTGTSASGGGGGGGGGMARYLFPTNVVPDSVVCNVGKGGVGGISTGGTGPGTSGTSATGGGPSIFGALLQAGGGNLGTVGKSAATANAGAGGQGQDPGGTGGSAPNGAAGNAPNTTGGGAQGGGGGGGYATTPAAAFGGHGGGHQVFPESQRGDRGSATNATLINGYDAPTPSYLAPGGGGGGGASSITAGLAAGNGGKGKYGGGGGGGGAGMQATAPSGSGGVGGDGFIVVTTFF